MTSISLDFLKPIVYISHGLTIFLQATHRAIQFVIGDF